MFKQLIKYFAVPKFWAWLLVMQLCASLIALEVIGPVAEALPEPFPLVIFLIWLACSFKLGTWFGRYGADHWLIPKFEAHQAKQEEEKKYRDSIWWK